MDSAGRSIKDLGEYLEKHADAKIHTVKDPVTEQEALVAFVPERLRVFDLSAQIEAHLPRPRRARGMMTAQDVASFVTLVNRFKDQNSRVFAKADAEAPELVAVLDHHEAANDTNDLEPRFGQHRVRYACPLSEEWQAWASADGRQMAQGDFAAFLEDRIGDVILPDTDDEKVQKLVEQLAGRLGGPTMVIGLSRGLEVNVGMKVKSAVTLSTGEISAQFETEHRDSAGDPIRVANLFFIAIPVFFNGPRYKLAVKLRYRTAGGALVWHVGLHRPDLAFDDAFRDIVSEVREKTALDTVLGIPEQ